MAVATREEDTTAQATLRQAIAALRRSLGANDRAELTQARDVER